jgi:hypothetical protein
MGDRPHVVEELGIDRPLLVLAPDGCADERLPGFLHGIGQRESLAGVRDVAEAFIGYAILIGSGSGRGEPALVDAAAIEAEGVKVIGMKLQALAGLKERARHPGGGHAEQAAVVLERAFEKRLDVAADGLEFSYGSHGLVPRFV